MRRRDARGPGSKGRPARDQAHPGLVHKFSWLLRWDWFAGDPGAQSSVTARLAAPTQKGGTVTPIGPGAGSSTLGPGTRAARPSMPSLLSPPVSGRHRVGVEEFGPGPPPGNRSGGKAWDDCGAGREAGRSEVRVGRSRARSRSRCHRIGVHTPGHERIEDVDRLERAALRSRSIRG
jgi:hypothetical protein